MKKAFIVMTAIAAFSCSCQGQQTQQKKAQSYEEDNNYQDRRRQMKMQQNNHGCCESKEIKAQPQEQKTAASTEVKVEQKAD